MKKIAKKNQIVIATLAVMIAAAGYMNYSGKLFPNKTKTQETNSELANKELLDISDEDASVSSGDMKSQEGDSGSGRRSSPYKWIGKFGCVAGKGEQGTGAL